MNTAPSLQWRKASASASGNCVEVAVDQHVHVRDSKDPQAGSLTFAPEAWGQFLDAVRDGTFGR